MNKILEKFFHSISSNNNAADDYINMLKQFDYGNNITYVIGHKSPDADTVGSAMAYADLLNQLDIKAQAVVSGPINSETKYFFDYFGIKTPEILTNANGKQFVLVDHSNYLQSIDEMKSARIIGIIDHHNVGDITTSEIINAKFAPVGSTASLIYRIYNECNLSISENTAKVMLMSILSDTNNLTKSTTRVIDKSAYNALKKIIKMNDTDLEKIYKGMAEAKSSYDGMSDEDIYKSDYKEYEIGGKLICIGNVKANGNKNMKDMAERMYNVMAKSYDNSGFDMMFSMISNTNETSKTENMTIIVAYGDGAAEIIEEAFGKLEDKKYYITRNFLSRKTHAIPAITNILTKTN
eukprot:jgi/Orpsp1_1/1192249/evm.model.d7180000091707.1